MLLRQTLLYLPAQLLGPMALFVAGVVWTHLMAPEPYGALMLVMAMQEFVFAFGLAWLSLTVLRYRDTLERSESAERFRRAEAALLYASIIVQTIAVWIVLRLIGRATPELVGAASLFIVTRSLLSHFADRVRAGGDIAGYTPSQIAGPVLGFAAALLATHMYGPTPAIALAGYAIIQSALLPMIWIRSGAIFIPGAPTEALLKPLREYGAPLLLISVATWVCINGIRLVVDVIDGAVALGLISVGWGLGQRLASTVAMLVTAAAFPLAVKAFNAGDRSGAMDQIARNGALLVALLAPALVGLVLVNESVVNLLIGEEFQSATIAILPLAALSGVLRCVRMHYADQAFLLHERTGFMLAGTVAEAVLTIAFAIAGSFIGGVYGAVAGATIAHGLVMIATFVLAVRMLDLRILWGDFARIGVATTAMAAAVLAMPLDHSAARLIATVAVGAAVYGAALLALFPEMGWKLRSAIRA
ncbi:MAG: oligosaccharide flippase family protein [Beijerinckiaceae bacterium]